MLELIKLIAYILVSYGFSNMICFASGPWHIFEKWREFAHYIGDNFGELFTCMLCLSTWIGLFMSLINSLLLPVVAFTPFNMILAGVAPFWFIAILDMGFTSACVWILHQFEEMMERAYTVSYEDETEG